MYRRRRKTAALTTLALIASLAVAGQPASADSFYIGGKWHNPQNLQLYDLTGPSWTSPLRRAVDLWNQSSVVHLNYHAATSCPQKQNTICVVERDPGCWAYSVIGIRRDTIVSPADAVLGDIECDLAGYPGWHEMVACHELGHTIGLGDWTGYPQDSCEAGGRFVNGEFTNTTPDATNFEELVTIYGK